jgi:hypothetical protein
MKYEKQCIMILTKVNNPTVTDNEEREEEKSPDKELNSIVTRMMNEMNEDLYKM